MPDIVDSGDCAWWDVEAEPAVIAARKALEVVDSGETLPEDKGNEPSNSK
jgi:hypothetical protein